MALKVCRICGDNKDLKNILEQGPEMIEKLIKCANVQIYIEDQLPKLICQQCEANLDLSYRLRKQSDATQRRLRHELKVNQIIQEYGEPETVLQNREEHEYEIGYKDEELLEETNITNRFQSAPLAMSTDAIEGDYTKIASGISDICNEEEFQTIDNIEARITSREVLVKGHYSESLKGTSAICNEEEFHTIDNIESKIISSEVLAKSDSSESFKVFGSQNDGTLSSTEEEPYLDTLGGLNEINPIITDQINISMGPLDQLVNKINEIPQRIREEIVINDDDDDYIDNINNKNFINEASRYEAVVEHCSIDLVTSSDSSSDECEEEYTILQNKYNSSSYTCETCQQEFSTKTKYSEHIKQHGSQRFQCIQCCKFFPTRFRLARHEETHIEVPLQQCGYCHRGYRAMYNLERHVQSVHTCSKKFSCDICYLSFSRVDVLKRHMQLHSDKKDYACTKCSQSFKTKDYLYSHRKRHHPSESSEIQNFTTKIRSKREEKTNKYQCGNCGNLFKSSFSYKNHLLIHTNEKPHECETCKKKFRTIAALMTHQRVHSDYRPYQCDICLKSFKQTSHLKEHKMLHLSATPQHICSICHATFLKKGNLNAHMRTHTKYKPFKCAACSSAFAFMHLLKRHANQVHGRIVDGNDNTSDNTKPLDHDNCIDITEDSAESEQYDYIDSVTDNDFQEDDGDDIVEVIEDNEVLFPSSPKLKQANNRYSPLSEKLVNNNSIVAIDEAVMTHMHIDSSNFINSSPFESDFIENITEEEFHITEQNVEVFVSEESKFTSFYNMQVDDMVQGKLS